MPDLPVHCAVPIAKVLEAPVGFCTEAVALNLAEGLRHALRHICAAIKGNYAPAPWNQIHEPLESCLHRFEVGVNVGMIELDVSENERIRKVVQKCWALVEEGCVILVALDDKSTRGPQMKAGSEVLGNASY